MRIGVRLLSGVIGVVLVAAVASHHRARTKRPTDNRDRSRLSPGDEGALELGPLGRTG